MGKTIEYKEGQQIGVCVFIKDAGKDSANARLAIFKCQCGKLFTRRIESVKQQLVTSCGCGINRHLKKRKYKQLGAAVDNISEYKVWCGIKERCNNPNSCAYHNYGGRGIRMHPKWVDSFDCFLSDVGRRPSPKHSLDRFPDNNGNYEPGNVRWAMPQQQARNKRTNLILEFEGQSMCAAAWAEKRRINPGTIISRINRGWSIDMALSTNKKVNQYG